MISKKDLQGIRFGTISDFSEYSPDAWYPQLFVLNNDYKSAYAIMGIDDNPNIKWVLNDIPVFESTNMLEFNPNPKENVRTFTIYYSCMGNEEFETIEVKQ